MAVFRVEKTKDFTIICNHHLRNTELSLKAKGLLSLMLSLPDNWAYFHFDQPFSSYLIFGLSPSARDTAEKGILLQQFKKFFGALLLLYSFFRPGQSFFQKIQIEIHFHIDFCSSRGII